MKIKLFVTYKELRTYIKSNIITPIQTGRAIAREVFKEMIGDDTGDNISEKNIRYCELSAQYWVWKNYLPKEEPDYIGFMHNRRHFIFNDKLELPKHRWMNTDIYKFPDNSDKYLEYIKDEAILSYFPRYDCLVIKKCDVKVVSPEINIIKERYIQLAGQKAEWFDILIEVLHAIHPEYREEIDYFVHHTEQYLCNMYVMRRDIYKEYCEFLFSTLSEVDKRIDSRNFSCHENRFLGYFGEFLLTIFMLKLYKNPQVKIKELNASFLCVKYKNILLKLCYNKVQYYLALGRRKQRRYQKYLDVLANKETFEFFEN